jgi:catechol 2,3-dioxygenase-like lactoylglutathione lyase family enzyme
MITGINHITLAVTDIKKSFEFYKDIMCFKPLCKWEGGAYFLVGDLWFCLNLDRKRVKTDCYTHYAFSVNGYDFDKAVDRLKQLGIGEFKDNVSEGASLYFIDPDGHKLEIHVGNWESRIITKKQDCGGWKNVEWFV